MAKASGGTRAKNSSSAHSNQSIRAQYENAKLERGQAVRAAEDMREIARAQRDSDYDRISDVSESMKSAGKSMAEIRAYRKREYEKADRAYDRAQKKADKHEDDADAKVRALKLRMHQSSK